MADYFLVHEGAFFADTFRPALAASWKSRSFGPARDLCRALTPAAREYARRYHTGPEEPLLFQVAEGLTFDRNYWRTLVGEILLFSAVEIPEFPTDLDTLVWLLAPEKYRKDFDDLQHLAPIQQAFEGSRDLTFGSAVYRPLHAGVNHTGDVARLWEYLSNVRPEAWQTADLVGLPDVADEEEREDELAFAQEWFPPLADLYRRAHERGQVIVLEHIF